MTDDLSMDAVDGFAETGKAAVLAVQAGNDLIISSDFPVQYAAVLAAVQDGTLTETQIDGHVRRVLDWKAALGLIDYKTFSLAPQEDAA